MPPIQTVVSIRVSRASGEVEEAIGALDEGIHDLDGDSSLLPLLDPDAQSQLYVWSRRSSSNTSSKCEFERCLIRSAEARVQSIQPANSATPPATSSSNRSKRRRTRRYPELGSGHPGANHTAPLVPFIMAPAE
jgi:hypothetical protein